MKADDEHNDPGWALPTWTGVAAAVVSSLIFLAITDRPWLDVSTSQRLWTGGVGIAMVALCLTVAVSGNRQSVRRCAWSASLFVAVSAVIFAGASI